LTVIHHQLAFVGNELVEGSPNVSKADLEQRVLFFALNYDNWMYSWKTKLEYLDILEL
jgi:hypothetical protein